MAQAQFRRADGVARLDHVAVALQGPPVEPDCGLETLFVLLDRAHQEEGFGRRSGRGQDRCQDLRGFLAPAVGTEQAGKIDACRGMAGAGGHGGGEGLARRAGLGAQQQAEVVPGIGNLGLERDRLAVGRDRLLVAAGPAEGQAVVETVERAGRCGGDRAVQVFECGGGLAPGKQQQAAAVVRPGMAGDLSQDLPVERLGCFAPAGLVVLLGLAEGLLDLLHGSYSAAAAGQASASIAWPRSTIRRSMTPAMAAMPGPRVRAFSSM